MNVELVFHFEITEEGKTAWWIESAEVDGFYAVGESVSEARTYALDALGELLEEPFTTTESMEVPPLFQRIVFDFVNQEVLSLDRDGNRTPASGRLAFATSAPVR